MFTFNYRCQWHYLQCLYRHVGWMTVPEEKENFLAAGKLWVKSIVRIEVIYHFFNIFFRDF